MKYPGWGLILSDSLWSPLALPQFNPKLAPLARLGFKIHLPAHAFDRFAHNSQADAGPFVFGGGVNPIEHAENPLIMLPRDADAVVLEIDPHMRIAWFGPNPDPRLDSRRDKFDGVVQEIGN